MGPWFGLSVWTLLKESFCRTHYPIRLNRKSRMVYAFRLDGSVLSVPWDDVFFTFGRGNRTGTQNWDIRGHVLDADGVTVKETFALGMEWSEQNDLRRFWELQRRYMEDGPQAITEYVPYCLPIADRKEPFMLGLRRLILNFAGHPVWQLVAMPIFLVSALGRWFAMRTSRIPEWPQEVENACRIEPGDPYERDARNNPPSFWKAT